MRKGEWKGERKGVMKGEWKGKRKEEWKKEEERKAWVEMFLKLFGIYFFKYSFFCHVYPS